MNIDKHWQELSVSLKGKHRLFNTNASPLVKKTSQTVSLTTTWDKQNRKRKYTPTHEEMDTVQWKQKHWSQVTGQYCEHVSPDF